MSDRRAARTLTPLLAVLAAALGCERCNRAAEAPATPPPAEEPAPAAAPAAPPAEDVCVEAVVVAWKGALDAPPDVERTQDAAQAKVDALLLRLDRDGQSFEELLPESDRFRERRGLVGVFSTDAWPTEHAALRGPVEALSVGLTTQVIEAPYGYAIARRCGVDHVRVHRLLVPYAGAAGAPEGAATKEEARARADALHQVARTDPNAFLKLLAEEPGAGEGERIARGQLPAALDGRVAGPLDDFVPTPVVELAEGFAIYVQTPDGYTPREPGGAGDVPAPGGAAAAPAAAPPPTE